MAEWQWLVNNGIALIVLFFIGLILWRVLVGTEKTGYQGVLIKWAQNLSNRVVDHATEATAFGRQREKEHKLEITALNLLVEAQGPPVGAAFLSARAVHHTAAEVVQLRRALLEFMRACRLIATQFPNVEAAIDGHCNEIERIIGESDEFDEEDSSSG